MRSLCYLLSAPDSPPARLQNAAEQLASLGWGHTVVTGFGPTDPEIAAGYSRWRNLVYCKRSLSNREIAAYLGHRLIWQRIIDDGHAYALVLEDDFVCADRDRAALVMAAAPALMADWHMLKLFDFRARLPDATFAHGGLRLAVYARPNSGLVGYFISRECCEALLAGTTVFRPADEEIRYWFRTRIRICSVLPNVVTDNSDVLGGSLIEADREDIRSRRNVVRSIWGNVITAYIKLRSWLWVRHVISTLPADSGLERAS